MPRSDAIARALTWARIDCHIESDPKIVAAGEWAPAVACALLRLAKRTGRDGVIAPAAMTGDYLARTIGAPASLASDLAAAAARLIACGALESWRDGARWPRAAWRKWQQSSAERMANLRARARAGNHTGHVTVSDVTVTKCDPPPRPAPPTPRPRLGSEKEKDCARPAGRARTGDPDFQKCMQFWSSEYERTDHCKPVIDAIEAKALKAMLAKLPSDIPEEHRSEAIRSVMLAYLDDPDPFIDKQGLALRFLQARLHKYLRDIPKPWKEADLGATA